jgi:hypothetical protein
MDGYSFAELLLELRKELFALIIIAVQQTSNVVT